MPTAESVPRHVSDGDQPPGEQVRTFTIPTGSITDPTTKVWQVLGPGHFQR